jgi:hypothetical protein
MRWKKDVDEELDEEMEDEELDELEELDEDAIEMMVSGRNYHGIVGFAAGLALGAVLGAGVALLTTPVRGDVMRRRLKHRVRDMTDDASDRVDQLKEDAGRSVSRTRRRLERSRRSRR